MSVSFIKHEYDIVECSDDENYGFKQHQVIVEQQNIINTLNAIS